MFYRLILRRRALTPILLLLTALEHDIVELLRDIGPLLGTMILDQGYEYFVFEG